MPSDILWKRWDSFLGGLNTTGNPNALGPTEFQDDQNFYIKQNGTLLRRGRWLRYNSTAMETARVPLLYKMYRSDGVQQFIAGCGYNIYASDFAATPTMGVTLYDATCVSPPLVPDLRISVAQYKNLVYLTGEGVNPNHPGSSYGVPIRWDGASTATSKWSTAFNQVPGAATNFASPGGGSFPAGDYFYDVTIGYGPIIGSGISRTTYYGESALRYPITTFVTCALNDQVTFDIPATSGAGLDSYYATLYFVYRSPVQSAGATSYSGPMYLEQIITYSSALVNVTSSGAITDTILVGQRLGDTGRVNPKGQWKYLAVHQDRMFYANRVGQDPSVEDFNLNGTSSLPAKVMYSSVGFPDHLKTVQFLDVATEDGQEITGLLSQWGVLTIFKQNSIYQLIGDDPSNYFLRPLTKQVGCIAPRSLVEYNGVAYFLSHLGVYRYDGGSIEHVSGKVDSIFATNPSRKEAAIGAVIRTRANTVGYHLFYAP